MTTLHSEMPSLLVVGLHKILSLLESDDPNVRIHAVKVVANLAAEGNLHFKCHHIFPFCESGLSSMLPFFSCSETSTETLGFHQRIYTV